MSITSSHCSATDLLQSAEESTQCLPAPFLLPMLNNECLVCPSMLIQAFKFSLSLVHPPDSGLPFSAAEASLQLQTCWFTLHPCAGCCWAERSPHQLAITAKAPLGIPVPHARGHPCKALLPSNVEDQFHLPLPPESKHHSMGTWSDAVLRPSTSGRPPWRLMRVTYSRAARGSSSYTKI